MGKALCIGINYYENINRLEGCVKDAESVAAALNYNDDGSVNIQTKLLCAKDMYSAISTSAMRNAIKELFKGDPDIALLYYSGHGAVNAVGGYLCSSETEEIEDGLSLDEIMKIAGKSEARNKIIILDSCHSGAVGSISEMKNYSLLPSGTIILAACGEKEYAIEKGGHGVFTSLLLQALKGGAMDILGQVTPGSIYSYVDQSLGEWDQRPVFKANIKNFVCLRKCIPSITTQELLPIVRLFENPSYEYPLDPTYEHDKNYTDNKEVNEEHEAIFELLRKYFKLNLVVPVDEEYMYWAAVRSKACKLTAKGQHYWLRIAKGFL